MAPVPGRTPIERYPFAVGLDPMVIDFNFRVKAPKEGVPYRPMAPQAGVVYGLFNKLPQEDWGSVADKFSVDVDDLISFNFVTTNSDVVNWCLRVYVGCERVSPSGNNWMFSERARPGIIFIPPLKDRTVSFAPENICVWTPQSEKSFMRKLDAIAQGLPGEKGKRIKRLMQVVLSTGYPAWRDLWYYNDMVIESTLTGRSTIHSALSRRRQRKAHSPLMDKRYGTYRVTAKLAGRSDRWGCGAYIRSGKCLMTFAATKTISTP